MTGTLLRVSWGAYLFVPGDWHAVTQDVAFASTDMVQKPSHSQIRPVLELWDDLLAQHDIFRTGRSNQDPKLLPGLPGLWPSPVEALPGVIWLWNCHDFQLKGRVGDEYESYLVSDLGVIMSQNRCVSKSV